MYEDLVSKLLMKAVFPVETDVMRDECVSRANGNSLYAAAYQNTDGKHLTVDLTMTRNALKTPIWKDSFELNYKPNPTKKEFDELLFNFHKEIRIVWSSHTYEELRFKNRTVKQIT